jgi:hypothetical protein
MSLANYKRIFHAQISAIKSQLMSFSCFLQQADFFSDLEIYIVAKAEIAL